MVFLTKIDDYQKMCDMNKKVTNMGVIIKGVFTVYFFTFTLSQCKCLSNTLKCFGTCKCKY
jgi:hypothetical protein